MELILHLRFTDILVWIKKCTIGGLKWQVVNANEAEDDYRDEDGEGGTYVIVICILNIRPENKRRGSVTQIEFRRRKCVM
jgi:hypothetical protein